MTPRTDERASPGPADPASGLRSRAGWVARHELWWLAAAAPCLLFPSLFSSLLPSGVLPITGLALIAATWLARWIATGRLTIRTPLDGPILVLACMTVVGYAVSADRALSDAKLWGLVLGFAIFYGMANGLHGERQVLRMAGALAWLTLAVTALSLVGTDWHAVRLIDAPWLYDRLPTLIRGVPGSGVPRASDLFGPREVGATLGLLLPVPLAIWLFGHAPAPRRLAAWALVAGGLVLLLSQSLQALAGLLAAGLCLAIWRDRRFLLALPLGAALLVAAVLAVGPAAAAVYALSTDNPVGIAIALRLDIWQRALAMIGDMPYTGIGINTFPTVVTQFYPGFLIGPEPHAHQLFLQTALDLGLPGLAAFLWLLAAFVVLVRARYAASADADYRVLVVGLAAAVLSFVVHGLFDAVTLGAKPTAALWAMLGLVAALPAMPAVAPELAPPGAGWPRGAYAAVALLLVLALSALALPALAYTNLGTLEAQQGLLQAQNRDPRAADTLALAAGHLREAVGRDPRRAQAYYLLGRIYGVQGAAPQALDALAAQVALDCDAPFARYYLAGDWLRKVRGGPVAQPWDDALQVYSQWMVRYPQRAEPYVQAALVWERHKGAPERAAAIVRSGLAQGAEPRGVLVYYLERLEK